MAVVSVSDRPIQRAADAAVNKRTQKEGRAEAFAIDGPAIVDCIVAADELPNIPHIELDLASHYPSRRSKKR
jgi:hypothetical protein